MADKTYDGPHDNCRETQPHAHVNGRAVIDATYGHRVCGSCNRVMPGSPSKCPFCGSPVRSF